MQQTPRLSINLSSKPFRKDRAMLAGAGLVAAVLVVLLAYLSVLVVNERNAAQDSRVRLDRLDNDFAKVSAEAAALQAQLRQPLNASVVDKSAFVNALLQRKGISWTKLFVDLQDVFPFNVRLVSVRPFVTADNKVQLEMVVGAQSPAPVILLLQNLENSPLFGETGIQSEQPPNQNEPLFRYRVSVSYAQKL